MTKLIRIKQKSRSLETILFLMLLWGPPRYLGANLARTPADSIEIHIDLAAGIEIAVWILIGAISFLSFLHNKKGIARKIRSNKPVFWLFIYGVACGVASFWSSAPALAGFRAAQILILLLTCLMLVERYTDSRKPLDIFYRWCLFVTLYNFIMYFISPSWVGKLTPEGYRLLGGIPFKPDFGLSGAMCVIFCLRQKLFGNKQIRVWLLLVIGFVVIGLSRVRGLIIPVAAITLFAVFKQKGKGLPVIMIALVVVGAMFGSVWESASDLIVRNPETFLTLSRRTEIWSYLLPFVWLEPFFGYGYVTGSRLLLARYWEHGVNIGGAHNSWIEAMVGTGLWGTIPLMMIILRLIVVVWRNTTSSPAAERFEFLAILVIIISWPMTNTMLNSANVLLTVFVLACSGQTFSPSRRTITKKRVNSSETFASTTTDSG